MKYSYNWIKELSGTTKSVDELAQLLLTHSFEIESITDLSRGLEKVVIGKVLTVQKHQNADRLRIATVDIGERTLQIVCGAPNLAVGQKVPVALVGAVLPCGIAIKKSTIRDADSEGMICAEDELGIGKDHAGIVVLDPDAPIGDAYATYAGRNDSVIDIKILPNRGHDCLSHIGIANEIRALEKSSFLSLESNVQETEKTFDVVVDSNKCKRYIAASLRGIKNHCTPKWMIDRLRVCDIKSINAIVDITNYVMLETGQPLHAFSAHTVSRIVVRQAQEMEKITLLDDTERTLTSDDLVITDGECPIALAGVMGGKGSAIDDDTVDMILESASFDAPTIRNTQRKYGLLTDAAFRYERDLDPNLTAYAVQRAIDLYKEICNADIDAMCDIYPSPINKWSIQLDFHAVEQLLGMEVPRENIIDILERLGMKITETAHENVIQATIPTIRRDLIAQEDLIEEIGRIYGYEKIQKKPLQEYIVTPRQNALRTCEHKIMDICVTNGFDEIKGYSYYSYDDACAIGLEDEKHVAVLNPLTPEHAIMRRSLLPEMTRAVKKNLSYFSEMRICDIGRIYVPTENTLPDERLIVGFCVASRHSNGEQFYDIKGLVENIFAYFGICDFYFDDVFEENNEHVPDLHSTRRALVRMEDGRVFGWIGELTRRTHKFYGIKKERVAACELSISHILSSIRSENFFTPLAKYPIVTRDLSMRVPQGTRVADMERVIYAAGGEFLTDVDVFDIYDDVETGERSLAFHMKFNAADHTLASEEVDVHIRSIIDALEQDATIEVRR